MIRTQITEQYSVSEQITLDDLNTLAAAGISLIVCNRPDKEEENQLAFADIAQRAQELNIKAVHIPFAGGQMQASDVTSFKQAIKGADKIHGYCRTGKRASSIWEAANTEV
ncbi:TIGR01244 family sulfur transferase [Marinomonas sp. C2222]|uniref:TIGR01244 family sulfur transferase n=1 Tax=Marinomonas sargassi TaxID=2984494 RepID=A0ABT2YTF8_9GAMM|nr:TIGR01244 family sulfur transferase [Marinomonas sargassi]MCV2403150.1 TIGR01244 family sulfur transferase [Marinomonas sargassi]